MSIPQIATLSFVPPTVDEVVDLGTTYLFDFETGEFLMENGAFVKVTGIASIKSWVSKIIHTEKFAFEIYEDDGEDIDYGISLQDVASIKYRPVIESEIRQRVTESLLLHPRIKSLTDWRFTRGDRNEIEFRINLVDGQHFTTRRAFG